jgi:hypothetical protein
VGRWDEFFVIRLKLEMSIIAGIYIYVSETRGSRVFVVKMLCPELAG